MGRPRKDVAVKTLRGTLRKDREPRPAPATIAGPMVAPVPLSTRALEHFDAIAAMLRSENRASQHFAYTVALLAQRLDQAEQLSIDIAQRGHTVETSRTKKVDGADVVTTMIRANPSVAMLADAMRHTQALLSELMLSPTAAQRVARPDKPTGNPFADL